MEHDAFYVPYLLDTTPEAAFHGQAVKTVVYLRVSTTQQVLGPEARTPEGLAGRLTARWQGGRNPALPRTGRFQDRHRQVWTCPVPPSTAHEHPRAQAEPLACISTRILSVPLVETRPILQVLDLDRSTPQGLNLGFQRERVYRAERGKELPEALRSQSTKVQGDGDLGTVGAECLPCPYVFTLDATQRDRLAK